MIVKKLMIVNLVIVLFLFSCEKVNTDLVFNEISLYIESEILPDYFVTSIDFDSKGVAWIGTFRQGLLSYENNELIIFNNENSIIDTAYRIWDIKVDKNDNVWIGADGLIKYDGTLFTKFDNTNSPIPENFVGSIAIDESNFVWFSSSRFKQGGLMNYDGNNWNLFTPENSQLPCNLIIDIVVDNENNKWIAFGQSVNQMSMIKISNDNIWTMITNDDFGFEPYMWGHLTVNNDNTLLASIDYGLSSIMDTSRPNIICNKNDNWSINNPSDETGKSFGYVNTISCDNNGNIWAAISTTGDNKLAVYKGDKWFVNNENLNMESIFVIKIDKNNKTWIGTGNGIVIISE